MNLNILHAVEQYPPQVGGMGEVVKQISTQLVRYGHQVTVATSRNRFHRLKVADGVKIEEFDLSGSLVKGIKGNAANYQSFLVNSSFDVVVNFAAQQWSSDLAFPLLSKIKAKKIFVPTGFSNFYNSKYQQYFQEMKSWMEKYDMNIFCGLKCRDALVAQKYGIKNWLVIPNGASAEEFLGEEIVNCRELLQIPENHFLILHVGSFTGLKGQLDAMEIFDLAKLTNSTLLLIGNVKSKKYWLESIRKQLRFNLSPKRRVDKNRILIKTLPRGLTVAAFKTADLFLFPSKIENSPITLFECLASKTPFLTTDVGNTREIINWSNGGILLPTKKTPAGYSRAEIRDSAKLLGSFYRDRRSLIRLGQYGFAAWKNRFTWEDIAKKYERLYLSLVGDK